MSEVLRNRQPDIYVVCEDIHDPHNVSAILRTCDAVGVTAACLLYKMQQFPKLGKKSSASARKWVEILRFVNHSEVQHFFTQKGIHTYATATGRGTVPYFEIDWRLPSAIIVGNEHSGVSQEACQISDAVVSIPMLGMVQSLNVSVAAAVILYEACRQRIAAGLYPSPDISQELLSRRLEEWLKR